VSVMHFANALVWEIIGPAMAGPTGPCATPLYLQTSLQIWCCRFDRFTTCVIIYTFIYIIYTIYTVHSVDTSGSDNLT